MAHPLEKAKIEVKERGTGHIIDIEFSEDVRYRLTVGKGIIEVIQSEGKQLLFKPRGMNIGQITTEE